MKKVFNVFIVIVLTFNLLQAQELTRRTIAIPGFNGFTTLKCDFHMHTVFSDGQVWPNLRIDEAWCDGLDAIAITDHIEYRPHKEQVIGDHNAAFTMALPHAKKIGITLIHGAEITRKMPPGHLNALFIEDANKLAIDSFRLAAEEVKRQNGIIFWNHPGWDKQQPDGIAKWYDEHSWLQQLGVLKGLEIVNEILYYPEVHQWCNDKNFALFGNSDIHIPTSMYFKGTASSHRTMTLVFAEENTTESIKTAILNMRTAVWSEEKVYGREEHLLPLTANCLSIKEKNMQANGKAGMMIQLTNNSDLLFDLELNKPIEGFNVQKNVILHARETVFLSLNALDAKMEFEDNVTLPYKVKNMFVGPEKHLVIPITFHVSVKPKK